MDNAPNPLVYSYLDSVFHQVYLAGTWLSFLFFFLPDLSISFSSFPAISRKRPPPSRSFTRAVTKALLMARSSGSS